jgi:hypothetical protein
MPVTKEMIADAALSVDDALDAYVAALCRDDRDAASERLREARGRLAELIAEYRRQAPQPESSPSVEPRV